MRAEVERDHAEQVEPAERERPGGEALTPKRGTGNEVVVLEPHAAPYLRTVDIRDHPELGSTEA